MAAWGGHWDFRFLRFWLFFRSVFRFLYSLRFADFPLFSISFSVFAKIPAGFRIWYSMRFSVFLIWSIWVPVSLRSERQFTRLHWSRIAAKRKCYSEECVTNQLKYRRDHKVAYVKPYPPPKGKLEATEPRLRFTLGGGEGTATCWLIPRGFTSLEWRPRLWSFVGVPASGMTNMVQQ